MVKKQPQKSHLICHVIRTHGPMSRVDIMRRVHVLSGAKSSFRPLSNHSYFAGGDGNGVEVSLIHKGLMTARRVGRSFVYELTPAGEAHADEYIAWRDGANQS